MKVRKWEKTEKKRRKKTFQISAPCIPIVGTTEVSVPLNPPPPKKKKKKISCRTFETSVTTLRPGEMASLVCDICAYLLVVGQVVKASAPKRKVRSSNPAYDGIFPGRVMPMN